jgi:hypothetical protein
VDSYTFTISEEMLFAKDAGPVTSGFSWTDFSTGKRYLLELEDESKMAELFQLTTCQCIFESKYNKTSADVGSETVLKFCGYVLG